MSSYVITDVYRSYCWLTELQLGAPVSKWVRKNIEVELNQDVFSVLTREIQGTQFYHNSDFGNYLEVCSVKRELNNCLALYLEDDLMIKFNLVKAYIKLMAILKMICLLG